MYQYINRKKIQQIIVYSLSFIIICGQLYYMVYSRWNQRYMFFRSHKSNNISCYDLFIGDALLSTGSPEFDPPNDSIFFHETSCRGGLNSRQCCSIESVARLHPKRHVYVLFSSPVSDKALNRPCLSTLKQYSNIIFARIQIDEYLLGTDLDHIKEWRFYSQTKWKVEHTADLLRLVTLYRFGGIYLDTDVMVVKPLDELGKNWIVKENEEELNSGVIAVAKQGIGHRIMQKVMKEISENFRADLWSYNGPEAITRSMQKICKTDNVDEFSVKACRGFEVYSPDKFYPIPFLEFKKYFATNDGEEFKDAYTHHIWNHLSSQLKVVKNSYYDQLAKKHCPIIYTTYGDDFGL